MRENRITEAQIIGMLREADAERAVKDISRDRAMSLGAIYRRREYSGMEVFDGSTSPTDENRRLKKLAVIRRSTKKA